MGAKYKVRDYEVLRRRCVELKEAKWPQKAIAEALGLTQGWVSQTLKKYRELGPAGLLSRKPTGAPTKLNEQQLAQLIHELSKGSQEHGYTGEIWTRARVKALIEKLFGVSYDPTQVGRILKKAGWSWQKPTKKARQQNVQKVQEWKENKLPELKKSY